MSMGASPSTMTVDPTPPGLRPMQNQLVQMLMSRLSGQGRSSVPTYGSGLPNVQQQLYGMDPRTPSTGGGSSPGGNQGIPNPHPTPITPYTPLTPPVLYGASSNTLMPNDINGSVATPGGLASSPPSQLYVDTINQPQSMPQTRSPFGQMQGVRNPWQMPSYGSIQNGSGMIRSFRSPYGYY